MAASGLTFTVAFGAFNGLPATQADIDEVMRALTFDHGGAALAGNVTLTVTYNDQSGPNGTVSQSIDLVPGIITGGARIVDYSTGSANNPTDLSNNPTVPNVIIDVAGNSVTEDPSGLAVSRTVSNVITPVGSNVAYSLTDDFIITGTDGDDVISSSEGDDIIRGGLGADNLNGGNGNNTFVVGSGEGAFDTITGGTGIDTLKVIEFGDFTASDLTSIEAIVFDDTSVQKQAGFMAEEVGNGLSSTTAVSGGLDAYNEIYFSISTGTTLDVSQFTFDPAHFYQVSIYGDDDAETVLGATGAQNTFSGSGGGDSFTGGDLNDTIVGGLGADLLYGGKGDDLFQAIGTDLTADEVMDGGEGFDQLYLFGSDAASLAGTTVSNIEAIYLFQGGTGMRVELGEASQALLVAGAFGTSDTVAFDGYLAPSDLASLAAAGEEHVEFKNANGLNTVNYAAGLLESIEIVYNPSNTTLQRSTLQYNPSGALTSAETLFDNGIDETVFYSNGKKTSVSKLDTLDAFDWSGQVFTYKADGVTLESVLSTADNGDTTLTTYGATSNTTVFTDVSHSSPLTGWSQTTGLDGKPIGSTFTYDNGRITTLDYSNGVLARYEDNDSLNALPDYKMKVVEYNAAGVEVRQVLTLDNNNTYEIQHTGGVLTKTIYTDGSHTAPYDTYTVDFTGGVFSKTTTVYDNQLRTEVSFDAAGHKTAYFQSDDGHVFTYDTLAVTYKPDGSVATKITTLDNGHKDVVNNVDGGSLAGGSFNDTLIGHPGMDTFVFGPNGGNDYVSNFQNGVDLLDLSAFGLADFAAVRAHTVANGANGIYMTFDNGEHLAVNGLSLATFDASDLRHI